MICSLQNEQLITEHSYVIACIAHVIGIICFIFFFKSVLKEDAILFKNKWLKSIIIIVIGTVLLYVSGYLMDLIYLKSKVHLIHLASQHHSLAQAAFNVLRTLPGAYIG